MIEVLVLAHERGGQIVRDILEDLVAATTRDLKLLDEIETEGFEMRINARAVLVLPMARAGRAHDPDGPFRDFYRSSGRTHRRADRWFAQRGRWIPHRSAGEHARRAACVRLRSNDRHERARVSTGVLVLGGMSAALLCAGVAGLVVKPTPRLAGRVRPYTIVARADLGRSADVLGVAQQTRPRTAESWVCCSGRRSAPRGTGGATGRDP